MGITTKRGDDGSTQAAAGGPRLSKAAPAIQLTGAIDETIAALNSVFVCQGSECVQTCILDLQTTLFHAACASLPTADADATLSRWEAQIDDLSAPLNLNSFSILRT
ncbi:MAG: hypothetical protein LBJ07_03995, partial [Actinomycetes bacterium]|nr:hypothetical protein [Actinomycetes bacterium]